jgi:hypothetical protein
MYEELCNYKDASEFSWNVPLNLSSDYSETAVRRRAQLQAGPRSKAGGRAGGRGFSMFDIACC